MKEEDYIRLLDDALDRKFTALGVTVGEPHEVQKDLIHLRRLRLGCEATKRNIIKAFITVTFPVTLYLIWDAFKDSLNK